MYVVAVLKHAIGIPLNDNKRDVEYCTIEGVSDAGRQGGRSQGTFAA